MRESRGGGHVTINVLAIMVAQLVNENLLRRSCPCESSGLVCGTISERAAHYHTLSSTLRHSGQEHNIIDFQVVHLLGPATADLIRRVKPSTPTFFFRCVCGTLFAQSNQTQERLMMCNDVERGIMCGANLSIRLLNTRPMMDPAYQGPKTSYPDHHALTPWALCIFFANGSQSPPAN